MSAPEDYRWMTCSQDADWATAQYRHLVVPGQFNTVCGCSASHPEVWRINAAKPNCPACVRAGKNIVAWQTNNLLALTTEEKPEESVDPGKVENPRADYQRAHEIKNRFEKVVKLVGLIMEELKVIEELMTHDYPDVAKFESRGVAELRTVLRVTFRRPVWALLNHWNDNAVGRTVKG